MTNEQTIDLVRRWQAARDEAAATELVKGYGGAISFAVRIYAGVPVPAWITPDDLAAVAAEALIEVATHFDPECGCSFFTVALYRMRSRIRGRVLAFLQAKKRQCEVASLDAPVGEDGAVRGDFVADATITPADDSLASAELRERLDFALRSLPGREERVLRLRFGVGVEEPVTLEAVGAELGCTKQRVRQIEIRALRMLQHPSRMRLLRAFSSA